MVYEAFKFSHTIILVDGGQQGSHGLRIGILDLLGSFAAF